MTAPVTERSFTSDQRKAMAKKGTAMSDGSFPISNTSDLANAVKAYGRASNKTAAKRHIIKRARALGAVGSLPEDWNVSEAAPAVHETGVLSERATAGADGRWPVQIITAGIGSSGYYSPDVLERAADNHLIEVGTPMFFDHPSKSQRTDRPERSVRDIGAVFTGAATYDAASQRLVGEVQVFGPYRDLVKEMAPHIGLSIDGSATEITEGMVDGRRVPVIEDLFAINSVDMVTKAGRGGQFLSLYESARAETDRQAEQAGAPVTETAYSVIQTALCDATKSEYGGDKTYVWVRDFDDETVWFEVSTSDSEALYGQGYSFDAASGQASLTGDRTEVRQVTSYVPATRPDGTSTTESQEENQMGTKQIEESEYTRLTEAVGRVDTLEAELKEAKDALAEATKKPEDDKPVVTGPRALVEAQINEQKDQIARLQAAETARLVIGECLAEAWIGDTQKARLTTALMGNLPMKEGTLDEDALRQDATERINEAETEAAEILKSAGVGTPRGLGALSTPATEVAGQQFEDALRESFIQRGMSEDAANLAVKGR